jgi:sarcosine oxidase gamma subunit
MGSPREWAPLFAPLQTDGLTVEQIPALQAASLRYFEPHGSFTTRVRQIAGLDIPKPLAAASLAGGGLGCVLAWRSPTDTLLLSDDAGIFEGFRSGLAGFTDGCMVDQTGGLIGIRVQGAKSHELMQRLGSDDSIARPGEALTGRFAELQVLTLCFEPGTLLLVVDRVYLRHLLGWIEATVADF